tara:strand:- start:351 stop:608 length:258 start_codon:yes stop_codon:yes gene_type:complete
MTELGIWILGITVWGLSTFRLKEIELQEEELRELTSWDDSKLMDERAKRGSLTGPADILLWEFFQSIGILIFILGILRFIYLLVF